MLRKLLLQIVAVFVHKAQVQGAISNWVVVAAPATHLHLNPYHTALLNNVETAGLVCTFISLSGSQL